MSETTHRVEKIALAPGETIESYGYTPDDIILAEEASYTSGGKQQDLIALWVLSEAEVEE